MLTVAAALAQVLEFAAPLPAQRVELRQALGRILAEPVTSDIDSPPHDKSIVDGYAIVAADAANTAVELIVLEEITAGAVPTRSVTSGHATRIMTGAPIPPGADAVVMVEQTELVGDRVRILQSPVKAGQNIMRRAASLASGQQVLAAGQHLRPMELGLLAEVGCPVVSVIPPPSVAVLVTGNELVDFQHRPAAGQIRNSNGPLLESLALAAGANVRSLGIARDERHLLEQEIRTGLTADLLVLSGGVSAGVLDLVPAVLSDVGVDQVFHKVNLKPGKPLWFGIHRSLDRQTLVFGLPGNPVSSLVCFQLFVLPAIQQLSGQKPTGLLRNSACLTTAHLQRGDRQTYWPACFDSQQNTVTPLNWKGSGDLRTLTEANCLAEFATPDHQYAPGDAVEVLLFS